MGNNSSFVGMLRPVVWDAKYSQSEEHDQNVIKNVHNITLVMNALHIYRNSETERWEAQGKDEKFISGQAVNIKPIIARVIENPRDRGPLFALMTNRPKVDKYVENLAIGRTGDIYLGNLFNYYYQECTWLNPEINDYLATINYRLFDTYKHQLAKNAPGVYDTKWNRNNLRVRLRGVLDSELRQIINLSGRARRLYICKKMREKGKSASGEGSSIKATAKTKWILNIIIARKRIGVIVDLACGDLTWMKYIISEHNGRGHPGLTYIGNDIAQEVVETHNKTYADNKRMVFLNGAMGDAKHMSQVVSTWNKLHRGRNTIILCREVFQHMHADEVRNTLNNVKRFINEPGQDIIFLATNYIYQPELFNNIPIISGGTNNRNLFVNPWNLPATCTFDDNHDKRLYTTRGQKSISAWLIKSGTITSCSMNAIPTDQKMLCNRREKEKKLHREGMRERKQKERYMRPLIFIHNPGHGKSKSSSRKYNRGKSKSPHKARSWRRPNA